MLTTIQAAKILGVHPNTMVNWRWAGNGPKYLKRGNRVYYLDASIKKWKAEN